MTRKPVLIYTDDGRDVDDVEAITYLKGCSNVDIVGIVTTHMIPDRRAMIARAIMDGLGQTNVPIGVGSIWPIGKDDERLVRYLREHRIQDRTYEGHPLVECFPDGIDLINKTIEKYGSDLSICIQAPLTDLAKVAQKDPLNFSKVGGLYIQGNANVQGARLVPDAVAYNIKEDEEAARIVFDFQDRVQMTIVGKWAAYQIPLTKVDFEGFAETLHPVGNYMRSHAYAGLECFVERAPEVFKKVFKIPAEQDPREALKTLENLSYPYDAVTAVAFACPEHFRGTKFGNHTLIGMDKSDSGIVDAGSLKAYLIGTMMTALRQSYIAVGCAEQKQEFG